MLKSPSSPQPSPLTTETTVAMPPSSELFDARYPDGSGKFATEVYEVDEESDEILPGDVETTASPGDVETTASYDRYLAFRNLEPIRTTRYTYENETPPPATVDVKRLVTTEEILKKPGTWRVWPLLGSLAMNAVVAISANTQALRDTFSPPTRTATTTERVAIPISVEKQTSITDHEQVSLQIGDNRENNAESVFENTEAMEEENINEFIVSLQAYFEDGYSIDGPIMIESLSKR